jgi:hypothetical protein
MYSFRDVWLRIRDVPAGTVDDDLLSCWRWRRGQPRQHTIFAETQAQGTEKHRHGFQSAQLWAKRHTAGHVAPAGVFQSLNHFGSSLLKFSGHPDRHHLRTK